MDTSESTDLGDNQSGNSMDHFTDSCQDTKSKSTLGDSESMKKNKNEDSLSFLKKNSYTNEIMRQAARMIDNVGVSKPSITFSTENTLGVYNQLPAQPQELAAVCKSSSNDNGKCEITSQGHIKKTLEKREALIIQQDSFVTNEYIFDDYNENSNNKKVGFHSTFTSDEELEKTIRDCSRQISIGHGGKEMPCEDEISCVNFEKFNQCHENGNSNNSNVDLKDDNVRNDDDAGADAATGDVSNDSSDDDDDDIGADASLFCDSSRGRDSPCDDEILEPPHIAASKIKTKHEFLPMELPSEDSPIPPLEEHVTLTKLGKITGVVDSMIIIASDSRLEPLDIDSVMWRANREPLGKVFEVFGRVEDPHYVIRLTADTDIEENQIVRGEDVFVADNMEDFSKHISTSELRKIKGSDASWQYDEEPPEHVLDFSDDEEETRHRRAHKRANLSKSSNSDPVPLDNESVTTKSRKKQNTRHHNQQKHKNYPQKTQEQQANRKNSGAFAQRFHGHYGFTQQKNEQYTTNNMQSTIAPITPRSQGLMPTPPSFLPHATPSSLHLLTPPTPAFMRCTQNQVATANELAFLQPSQGWIGTAPLPNYNGLLPQQQPHSYRNSHM
eukprot:gene4790-6858_t